MDIAVWIPGDTEQDVIDAEDMLEMELPFEWYTGDFGVLVPVADIGDVQAEGFVAESCGLIERHVFNPWTMEWLATGWDGAVAAALERFGLKSGFVFIVPCR